jgi:hypothetical protein
MCEKAGEMVFHLLLHCEYTQELWSFVFCLFWVQWVMPSRFIDLLMCWKGSSARSGLGDVWSAVPLCLRWLIWWERNVGHLKIQIGT